VHFGKLQRLFKKDRQIESAMRTLLHDLRAPLGVIQGFIKVARSAHWFSKLEKQDQQIFEILLRNANFMIDLTNDLADTSYSHVQEQISVNLEKVHLDKFCHHIVEHSRAMAAKKNIAFNAVSQNELPKEWIFDPIRIRQVFDNLVTNAIKFSEPGSQISFSMNLSSGRLFFSIKDTGQGIPQGELPKLFKDFGKTSVRPTSGEPSTGLGLAIVKRIVEAHGGEIGVVSIVNMGSTFTFSLPSRTVIG
jgi:signal transduction histidine kinase